MKIRKEIRVKELKKEREKDNSNNYNDVDNVDDKHQSKKTLLSKIIKKV